MYQRLLTAVLLVFLAFGSAAAPAAPELQPEKNFRLKGVLISGLSRTALLNGQSVQEGSRVGGAEILAIEQHGIRVRVGARELTIDIGGTLVTAQSSIEAQLSHEVKSGETLSGIALRHRKDGVTVDQMMMALYQSNPQAFSSNINVLHANAILRIPDAVEVQRQSPVMAAAEVARHADSWRSDDHQPVRVADTSHARQFGPVEGGQTLSQIALSVLHDGVTLDQMMIAMHQSNPQAFSGNINVLHEGAVLTIPGAAELRRQNPETATAEVVRQTTAWRTGLEQHALSTLEHANIMATAAGL